MAAKLQVSDVLVGVLRLKRDGNNSLMGRP